MGYGGSKEERHEKNRAAQVRYLADPEKRARHYARVAESNARKRQEHSGILDALRDIPCPDCGLRWPKECYDFDHVRGEKLGAISRMAGTTSTKRLLAELAKCDVVCANCHRVRTATRRSTTIQPVTEPV